MEPSAEDLNQPEKLSEHLLVFYAAMFTLGLALIYTFDLRLTSLYWVKGWFDIGSHEQAKQIFALNPIFTGFPLADLCLLGGLVGTGLLACSFGLDSLSRSTPVHRNFMAKTIGALTPWRAIGLVGLSILAEESFFRGGMQNLVGPTWAVLMYSLLHLKMDSKRVIFNIWNLKALLLGVTFSYLYHITESLIPATIAHLILSIWTYFFLRFAYQKQGKLAFLVGTKSEARVD